VAQGPLWELAEIVCGACNGFCCQHFPLYYEQDGRVYRNNIGYTDKGDLITTSKDRSTLKGSCYYYLHGGCPEAVKPIECRNWWCRLIEDIVTGSHISTTYENVTEEETDTGPICGKSSTVLFRSMMRADE